jgi:hypothetical protein
VRPLKIFCVKGRELSIYEAGPEFIAWTTEELRIQLWGNISHIVIYPNLRIQLWGNISHIVIYPNMKILLLGYIAYSDISRAEDSFLGIQYILHT